MDDNISYVDMIVETEESDLKKFEKEIKEKIDELKYFLFQFYCFF